MSNFIFNVQFKFYQSVIDEVVNGVRETFLDEKVDEKVLQALRSKWETKLIKTKAVDLSPDDHSKFIRASNNLHVIKYFQGLSFLS